MGDLVAYTDMLQRTYERSYPNPGTRLTKKCFSKAVFASEDTQNYLRSNLRRRPLQKTWVATLDGSLVGSVTVEESAGECDVRGFYVAPEYQGLGIGRCLWEKLLAFAGNRAIRLDTYAHKNKTIAMYKKWGFVVDTKKASAWSHWPEWPKGVRAKRIYMRLERR